MEQRENALREALFKNAEETERWKKYEDDNKIAKENLSNFSKHLTIDVMVPIGSKALIPGKLIHTNEVLVGHYQDYFSKCSAHKAMEICDYRLNLAKNQLIDLEKEQRLWLDKLEKPYLEGAIPLEGEHNEIIEEYDEEKERLWKIEHEKRLKEEKLREKANKQTTENVQTDEELFSKLEEAEILEELAQELDNLNITTINEETINSLIKGEYGEYKKKRIAHVGNNDQNEIIPTANENITNQLIKSQLIVKIDDVKKQDIPATNNNTQTNPELLTNEQNNYDDDDNSEDDIPEEITIIKEECKDLAPEKQIEFYEYQSEIIRSNLNQICLNSEKGINEKLHLLAMLEHLEELQEIMESTIGADELASAEKSAEESEDSNTEHKRRISFASDTQTIEFNKHETVAEMIPQVNDTDSSTKLDINDVIETAQNTKPDNSPKKISTGKKKHILECVEKNQQHTSEHQSQQNFDLVGQILNDSDRKNNTLCIYFKHSEQPGYDKKNLTTAKNDDIPNTPGDINCPFIHTSESMQEEPQTIFVNSYEGEDKVKVPFLREAERATAYKDPKAKFSNPNEELYEGNESNEIITKSILRNRHAVNRETHNIEPKTKRVNYKSSKRNRQRNESDSLDAFMSSSAYHFIMGDILGENEPDLLPDGEYVDTHAPKQRISRFKEARSTKR